MRRLLSILAAAALVATFAGPALAGNAVKTSVIYSSLVGNPIPGNIASIGVEAYSFNELGNAVTFTGPNRTLNSVIVTMSSFGCVTGHWNTSDCSTPSGATFSEPITLNIYSDSPNVATNLLTSVTQTFAIPYRPSASTKCTGVDVGKWYDNSLKTCFNGLATNITFNFSGVTLPDSIVFGIAYNTSTHGYSPYGTLTSCFTDTTAGGCGYDSLNIALSSATVAGSNTATWQNSWVDGQDPELGAWDTTTEWSSQGYIGPAVQFKASR